MRKPLLFLLWESGEDRTRDFTVHYLTSCRRRHREDVD